MTKPRRAVRRSPKPKLLLDEGLPPQSRFPLANRYADIKHVKHDFGLGGAIDEAVYSKANELGRLVIVYNVRDFRPLLNEDTMSIIGVSTAMSERQLDIRLTSLLKRIKPNEHTGLYLSIGPPAKKR